jgi:hypothetical protein
MKPKTAIPHLIFSFLLLGLWSCVASSSLTEGQLRSKQAFDELLNRQLFTRSGAYRDYGNINPDVESSLVQAFKRDAAAYSQFVADCAFLASRKELYLDPKQTWSYRNHFSGGMDALVLLMQEIPLEHGEGNWSLIKSD